jgi:hypothetical protein
MSDDRFEEFVRDTAKRAYHEPPPVPRDEIWARLEAARRPASRPRDVVDIRTRRPVRWIAGAVALAAVLLLGVLIGRFTANPARPATVSAVHAPDSVRSRPNSVMRFATIQHLSQVQALLVDYESGRVDADFRSSAEDLLFRTRLLLDADRLDDPALKALLGDLELLLAEVAQLPRAPHAHERELIDQGLNERAIRSRLRNAIPAGPTA